MTSSLKIAGPWSCRTINGRACTDSFRLDSHVPPNMLAVVGPDQTTWRGWRGSLLDTRPAQTFSSEKEAQDWCDAQLQKLGWSLT